MRPVVFFAVFLMATSSGAMALDCPALDEKATLMGDHLESSESGRVAVGEGRVAFYSAPDVQCKEKGTFVLAGESLDAYLIYRQFTFVLYINSKNGNEATGWVLSSRLKGNGFGIGPAASNSSRDTSPVKDGLRR
jgi:hypothetical protein